MALVFGSARMGENGKITGGKDGDQKQTSSLYDNKGEVSMQDFYVSSKGWNVLRAKSDEHGEALASSMKKYCNDVNVGYNQNERTDIMTYDGTKKVNTDCSALVRRCIKDATGKDVGNFTTLNEKSVILLSGLFYDMGGYTSDMELKNGDILVTKTKGHTGIICSGNPRVSVGYSRAQFIVDVQTALGIKVDGVAGANTLAATVTVSSSKNYKHKVVKPIQKYLNAQGYNCGTVDGSFGSKTTAAVKAYQTAKGCTSDGVITAKHKTWKKLLGLA